MSAITRPVSRAVSSVTRPIRRAVGLPVSRDIRAAEQRAFEQAQALSQQEIAAADERAAAVQADQQAQLDRADQRRRRQLRSGLEARPSLFDILGAGQQRSTLG